MNKPMISFYINDPKQPDGFRRLEDSESISYIGVNRKPKYVFAVGFPIYKGNSKILSFLANLLIKIKEIPINRIYRDCDLRFVSDSFTFGKEQLQTPKWWQKAVKW